MPNLAKTCSALMLSLAAMTAQGASQQMFTTELNEIRTSSIDGRALLTIHINSRVGPANCSGNVLRVDTKNLSSSLNLQQIEYLALEAVLTSEPVVLTIPLSGADCIDGMPTVTDIMTAENTYLED